MKVILRPQAQTSVKELFDYLCDIGYPDTAASFTERLRVFILSLSEMPERISICRFKLFAERNLRCAVFNKSWVIVFKVAHESIIVLNIIHASRLKG